MAEKLGIWADKKVGINAVKKYHKEHDQHGENNPNWKDGIAKNRTHYKKVQKARCPEKVRARELLELAVERGKIKRKPCEVCGNPETEAHHTDYSKPYDVQWL